MECGASVSGSSLMETLTVVFCLSHVEAVTQRRDCKQLQNHTHISTCRRMELTPFNAHRRSLSDRHVQVSITMAQKSISSVGRLHCPCSIAIKWNVEHLPVAVA